MKKRSMVYFFLWISSVCQSLELCTSLNEEERAILAFKHKIEYEPYSASSEWGENNAGTCSRLGVDCSKDGRVVSLNVNNFPVRRLLGVPVVTAPPPEHHHDNKKKGPSPAPSTVSPSPNYGNMHHPPSPTTKQPVVSPNPQGNKKKHASWVLYVAIGAAVSCLIVLFALCLMFCRANKVVSIMPWRTGVYLHLQKAFATGVASLKWSELDIACEGFSNIIGSLSTCKLYKGTLSNGAEIAVTSTMVTSPNDWSDQDEDQFRKKISMLSEVNHKNFINLIGYCEEADPFTRMMVFDYPSPNGTLFEHLHIKEAEQLDWAARLRIMMGIAYCLAHMEQLNLPLNLQNLNSACIYLTEDYAAKVSDMEFWIQDEQAETTEESSDQENITYKFAIILLEVISGRLPFSEDDSLLVLWASSYLDGKRPLKDIVDPTVKSVSEESISALADVIRSCVNMNSHERPTMAEVCEQMRLITAISPDEACPRRSPLYWAELEIISSEDI